MLIDKFLDYISYETTSDESNNTCPSSKGQIVLGKHLLDELKTMGLNNCEMDEYGYVYAYIEGDNNLPTIGLLAHMDTSPDASGLNVKTKIIENYDGKDITLNDNVITSISRFPGMKEYIGKTLVVTDGKTLLGADDKAGIAIIMEAIERILNDFKLKHGPIWVCFTPDEEIGRGTDKFNYNKFAVDFAYTLDGDKVANIEYENFNASSAIVNFHGISVHPGSAKNKMINASKLLMEFNSMLDPNAVPEKTEGYEGFNHLVGIHGETEKSQAVYIIRNHDIDKLHNQERSFIENSKLMNDKYAYNCCEVKIIDGYRNMKEKFEGHMYPIELVKEAMKGIGLTCSCNAIRGGTDGANLTWNGILCPNLGTGGGNYHGVHEFWCVQDGEKAVELLLKILSMAKKPLN